MWNDFIFHNISFAQEACKNILKLKIIIYKKDHLNTLVSILFQITFWKMVSMVMLPVKSANFTILWSLLLLKSGMVSTLD